MRRCAERSRASSCTAAGSPPSWSSRGLAPTAPWTKPPPAPASRATAGCPTRRSWPARLRARPGRRRCTFAPPRRARPQPGDAGGRRGRPAARDAHLRTSRLHSARRSVDGDARSGRRTRGPPESVATDRNRVHRTRVLPPRRVLLGRSRGSGLSAAADRDDLAGRGRPGRAGAGSLPGQAEEGGALRPRAGRRLGGLLRAQPRGRTAGDPRGAGAHQPVPLGVSPQRSDVGRAVDAPGARLLLLAPLLKPESQPATIAPTDDLLAGESTGLTCPAWRSGPSVSC